jgi:hypothetical protein
VLEAGEDRIPVVVLATHTVLEGSALLADGNGTLVVSEGDPVELVGGFAPQDHPSTSAFVASKVSVLDR